MNDGNKKNIDFGFCDDSENPNLNEVVFHSCAKLRTLLAGVDEVLHQMTAAFRKQCEKHSEKGRVLTPEESRKAFEEFKARAKQEEHHYNERLGEILRECVEEQRLRK